jgi:hypothetical protein
VAPAVIERTAPCWEQVWRRGGSVSEAGRQWRDARGTMAVAGSLRNQRRWPARAVPVTEHEWPDSVREASRGSLSKPRAKRTWSISGISASRVRCCGPIGVSETRDG